MSEEKLPTKYYSEKQEKKLSEELGWAKIGGSGAAPCAPGDIKASEWLGECKTHTKPHSIYFDANVWKKISDEAFGHNKKPVLFVDDGSQNAEHTWALCYARNINMSSMIIADLPFTVKKNITFDHVKVLGIITDFAKSYVGEFYQGVAFLHRWNGEEVLIMPFKTFKEYYKK